MYQHHDNIALKINTTIVLNKYSASDDISMPYMQIMCIPNISVRGQLGGPSSSRPQNT